MLIQTPYAPTSLTCSGVMQAHELNCQSHTTFLHAHEDNDLATPQTWSTLACVQPTTDTLHFHTSDLRPVCAQLAKMHRVRVESAESSALNVSLLFKTIPWVPSRSSPWAVSDYQAFWHQMLTRSDMRKDTPQNCAMASISHTFSSLDRIL